MDYYGKENASAQWDDNFSQVLNRTRDNITRISSRYTMPPAPSSRTVPATPMPAPSAYQQYVNPMPTKGTVGSLGNSVAIDANVLNSMLDRLAALESSQGGLGSSNQEGRIAMLEKSLDAAHRKLESANLELQDAQRSQLQLGNQVTRQAGLLEVLQTDIDARRSVVSRMDSWARQGEIWRDDMENQLSSITRQIKDTNKLVADHRESFEDTPSRSDMSQLKDRMTIMTQQTVAASLSVWHDKIEGSLRQVERQVAAVRLGRTVGAGADAGGMSDREVQEALVTPQPSELLVKSMIDSAMMETERRMEASIEARVRQDIKGEQYDSMKAIREEIKGSISHLAAEAGLIADANDIGGKSAARQAISSKKAQERELELMANRVEDVSAALVVLQEGMDASEKFRVQEFRALERRVDESVAISNSHVNSMQARCAGLEELVRSSELSQRSALQVGREETLERIREVATSWSGDRSALDRRVLMVEKTAEDLVERLKISSSAIDSFFSSSAEGRRLQAAAARTELLQVDMQSVKTEIRETSNVLARMEAQTVNRGEYAELRDRIAHTENLESTVRRLENQLNQEHDNSNKYTNQLVSLEQAVTALTTGNQGLSTRINSLDKQGTESRSASAAEKETLNLLSMRVEQLHKAIRKEADKFEASLDGSSDQFSKVESSIRTLESKHAKLQQEVERDSHSRRLVPVSQGASNPDRRRSVAEQTFNGADYKINTDAVGLDETLSESAKLKIAEEKVAAAVKLAVPVKKTETFEPAAATAPSKKNLSPKAVASSPEVAAAPTPTPKAELPKKTTSPKPVKSPDVAPKTLVGMFDSAVSSPAPTAKPKRNISPPIVDIAPKEVQKEVAKEVTFTEVTEPVQETPKKADSDSDEFEFMDAKSGMKRTPAAKSTSAATPSSEQSIKSDTSATSPFAGLNSSVQSEREASPPVKKEKKIPMIPTLALPAKGTAIPASTFDEFEAPPSKRREDASPKAASAHDGDDEFDFTPSTQPPKPSKPTKAPAAAVAEAAPAKPEKALTAKERLALRREQLKDQKEKAKTPAKVASPEKTAKSPSGESVHEFEEYDDSFEN